MRYTLLALLWFCFRAEASSLTSNALPAIVGFGSCAEQGAPQEIWKAINASKPEVFVMLGDNIYGDTRDMQVLRKKYAMLGSESRFQHLWRNTRLLATWDDHDFGENDAGADYPMKRESQNIFMDFFKIPQDHAMRSREGVYSAEVFGPPTQRLQLILLDTRYYRSPLVGTGGSVPPKRPYEPNNDPDATILGAAQWEWLEQQLRQPAAIRLVFSSIQVLPQDHGGEKWMNFPRERERLFRLIQETQAEGVIFLSGDRHFAELSVIDQVVGYPLYDLTSSGLNKGYVRGWRPAELNRHRVAAMNTGNNFGVIRINWQGADTEIRLEIHDEQGDIRICQKIPLRWLSPAKATSS